jgi:predicted nucleic acid-binding protein
MTLIVDASVALKWFLRGEPLVCNALALIRDGISLIAPDILIAEVCNGAWRSARLGRIGWDQVSEIAGIVPQCFDLLVSSAALAPRAVALAAELDRPVSDCLYVALAEAQHVDLITADQRLLEKLRRGWGVSHALYLGDYEVSG